jgi:hypothetical protein
MARITARLVLLSTIGCTGCIPVISPTHPSAAVGPAGSTAPIQVGTATRAEVIARFGKPGYRTQFDRAIGYVLPVRTAVGIGFGPCCMPGIINHYAYENLWVEFDGRDVVKRFVAGNDTTEGSWIQFCSHVPDARGPSTEP